MIILKSKIYELAGITLLSFFLFTGSAGAYPPPAILRIDGNEQTSGIGSNCWREENQTIQICSDTIGIITPSEPLFTRSPFTAHLRLPLQEPPKDVGFSITRVADDDELKELANEVRVWRFKVSEGNRYKLPKERESDMNLSLESGLYVLNLDATWKDKGSVTYGFLVQVYNVSPTKKTTGFEIVLTIATFITIYIIWKRKM